RQRLPHVPLGQARRRGVVAGEHQVAQPGAEVRPHHPLAARRAQDDGDGLLDVLFVTAQGDLAVRRQCDVEAAFAAGARKRPAHAEKLAGHAATSYPNKTVPVAITSPTGRSAGSLQVAASSPLRAAILPLMNTVALPITTWPRLAGGDWNDVPGAVGT